MTEFHFWLYCSEQSFKLGQPDVQGTVCARTRIDLLEQVMREHQIPFVARAIVHYGYFPGGITRVFHSCSLSAVGFVYYCR